MIGRIRHKALRRLFEEDDARGLRPDLVERLRDLLLALENASTLEALDRPTFRLHALRGDLNGYWAVTVRANWRLIFRFQDGSPTDVDLVDYH
jgi:toxin HigB-1